MTDKLADALRALDQTFGITSHLIGNGCEHGFKPASSCPNKGCDEKIAHSAYDMLQGLISNMREEDHFAYYNKTSGLYELTPQHYAALTAHKAAKAATRQAIADADAGKVVRHSTVDGLMADLNAPDDLTIEDVIDWADGVMGALGTEYANRVTDKEAAIAHCIVSGKAALRQPQGVPREVIEDITERKDAATERLSFKNKYTLSDWEEGYEQGVEQACRHHLALLNARGG